MASEHKFFICKHCGNLVGLIQNSSVPMICCGEEMTELVPNTVEASKEKHLPVVEFEKDGKKAVVSIGSAPHPMTEEHHIAWVYLQTEQGGQRKNLPVGSKPEVCFRLCGEDKAVAAFAYCNLHGLWKTEI